MMQIFGCNARETGRATSRKTAPKDGTPRIQEDKERRRDSIDSCVLFTRVSLLAERQSNTSALDRLTSSLRACKARQSLLQWDRFATLAMSIAFVLVNGTPILPPWIWRFKTGGASARWLASAQCRWKDSGRARLAHRDIGVTDLMREKLGWDVKGYFGGTVGSR